MMLALYKTDNCSIYNNMTILKWFLKIFAIDWGNRQKNKIRMYCSIIKKFIAASIFGFLVCSTLYYKMLYIFANIHVSIKITDSVQTFYDYFQYLVDLYFVTRYGGEISFEYVEQYKSIDSILDMVHHSTIQKRLAKVVVVFLMIWLTTCGCDFMAWYYSYGLINPTVYSLSYIFLLIKILTTLDLTSQVIYIEYRLRTMGDCVQDYYISTDSLNASESLRGIYICDSICNKQWFYTDEYKRDSTSVQVHPLKSVSQEIKWLSRYYLLLTEQCTFINRMYGMRNGTVKHCCQNLSHQDLAYLTITILLNSLSLLIDMIRYANIAARIIIGTQQTTYDVGNFPAVASLMRLASCAAVLASLVHHCEQAYRQCDRTVSLIDHLLINKRPGEMLRAAATELRGLVQSRPISFNLANFFRLDYSFLVSTASVLVTYTIILLQSVN